MIKRTLTLVRLLQRNTAAVNYKDFKNKGKKGAAFIADPQKQTSNKGALQQFAQQERPQETKVSLSFNTEEKNSTNFQRTFKGKYGGSGGRTQQSATNPLFNSRANTQTTKNQEKRPFFKPKEENAQVAQKNEPSKRIFIHKENKLQDRQKSNMKNLFFVNDQVKTQKTEQNYPINQQNEGLGGKQEVNSKAPQQKGNDHQEDNVHFKLSNFWQNYTYVSQCLTQLFEQANFDEVDEIIRLFEEQDYYEQAQQILKMLIQKMPEMSMAYYRHHNFEINFTPEHTQALLNGLIYAQSIQDVSDLLTIVTQWPQELPEQSISNIFMDKSVLSSKRSTQLAFRIEVACQILRLNQTVVKQVYSSDVNQRKTSKRRQLPDWLIQIAQLTVKTKKGIDQFRQLFETVTIRPPNKSHQYQLSSFMKSSLFIECLELLYYDCEQNVEAFLQLLSIASDTKDYNLISDLRNSFMMHSINNFNDQNGRAFPYAMNRQIAKSYEDNFKEVNKFKTVFYIFLANYSGYRDLAVHFNTYGSVYFPPNTLNNEDKLILIEATINGRRNINYRSIFEEIAKQGFIIDRIKAFIKLGNHAQAFKIFKQITLDKYIANRTLKKIQYAFKKYIQEEEKLTDHNDKFNTKNMRIFLNSLSTSYLLSVNEKMQDFSKRVEEYFPADKYSFWEQMWNKERAEQLSKLQANGKIKLLFQKRHRKGTFNFEAYRKSTIPAVKGIIDENYEMEKELIKYHLYLKSVLEEAKQFNNFYLNEKLREYESSLGQMAIAVGKQFGVYGVDFTEGPDVLEQFKKNTSQMFAYNSFAKTPDLHMRETDLGLILGEEEDLRNFIWRTELIDMLLIKRQDSFLQAERIVKLTPHPLVNQFIAWGLYADEPMGIYLGQKLAMQTGQHIPHHLARKVSDYFSFRRDVPIDRIQECKTCLSVVGQINREHIYDFNKDYHHILVHKGFHRHMTERNEKDLHSDGIDFMLRVNPEPRLNQDEPAYYLNSAKKGRLVI